MATAPLSSPSHALREVSLTRRSEPPSRRVSRSRDPRRDRATRSRDSRMFPPRPHRLPVQTHGDVRGAGRVGRTDDAAGRFRSLQSGPLPLGSGYRLACLYAARPPPATLAILGDISAGTSYLVTRLVSRRSSRFAGAICTSAPLRASVPISQDFPPSGSRSSPFGYRRGDAARASREPKLDRRRRTNGVVSTRGRAIALAFASSERSRASGTRRLGELHEPCFKTGGERDGHSAPRGNPGRSGAASFRAEARRGVRRDIARRALGPSSRRAGARAVSFHSRVDSV